VSGSVSASVMTASDFQFLQHESKYNLDFKTVEDFNFRAAIFETKD